MDKINTKSDAWKRLLEMKKQYQRDKIIETGTIEVNSLIDGHKIGKIIFGKGK